MSTCPWYVSAHAVRRYQELGGAPGRSFDDASDELIERCAEVWQRYQGDPALRPEVSRTGAYVYRGPGPMRLRVVVSMEQRAEGEKPQVVDVISVERSDQDARRRRNARRKRQREKARDGSA